MTEPPAADPMAAFLALPLGTRVVVRHRIPSGATDVLGELLALSGTECQVLGKAGPVIIALADIVAAKQIPPPPAPRARR